MSDDDRPKGKGRKGGGKDSGRDGGNGVGGGKGGGGSRKGGRSEAASSGPPVSRLKVLPKFLQQLHAQYRPQGASRGLRNADLADKYAGTGTGRNDDDEYDVEGALIVNSDYDATDLEVLKRRSKLENKPKAFFAAEEKREEEASGPMVFKAAWKRKLDNEAEGKTEPDGKAESAKRSSEVVTGRRGDDAKKTKLQAAWKEEMDNEAKGKAEFGETAASAKRTSEVVTGRRREDGDEGEDCEADETDDSKVRSLHRRMSSAAQQANQCFGEEGDVDEAKLGAVSSTAHKAKRQRRNFLEECLAEDAKLRSASSTAKKAKRQQLSFGDDEDV